MTMPPQRSAFTRALLRVGAYDVVISVLLAALWETIGIGRFGVWLMLAALRLLVSAWLLRRSLARVSAFELAETRSDDEVLAVDEVLQRLHLRFGVPYAMCWLAMFGLGLGLVGHSLAEAEIVISMMVLVAALLSVTGRVSSLLDAAMLESRMQVSKVLFGRGLMHRRPRRSLRKSMAWKRVGTLLALFVGIGAISGSVQAELSRRAALLEQQRRVEVSALRIDGELGPLLEGVVLVDEHALPEPLRNLLSAELAEPSIALFDPARDLAMAAARTADGRWALAQTDPDEYLTELLLVVLLLGLAAAAPTAIGDAAQNKSLFAPIEELSKATRAFIERGELQTLARTVPLQNDEIGALASNFNDMLDMLEKLARAAEAVAAGDLSVELEHPGELHEAFRGMISRLAETVVRLRRTSLELASSATELHTLTQQQVAAELEQSANMQRVSVTVVSLADSAKDIATTAKGALADAERMVATTDVMIEKIASLREQAASVNELLDAIREIAERSDLLALNGSLEATRAGEAGRGFMLVATEMRRLAERVTGTVNAVRERVAGISASGAATVTATAEGRELAERTADAARAISAVTQRQSSQTAQVAGDVQSVESQVMAATIATSQTRATAEGLRAHAAELEQLTGGFEVPESSRPRYPHAAQRSSSRIP